MRERGPPSSAFLVQVFADRVQLGMRSSLDFFLGPAKSPDDLETNPKSVCVAEDACCLYELGQQGVCTSGVFSMESVVTRRCPRPRQTLGAKPARTAEERWSTFLTTLVTSQPRSLVTLFRNAAKFVAGQKIPTPIPG